MLVLAFVALGCILCFLFSVPAFILAWIPPVRRLFTWVLRWRFLVLGCLVTLVALFYAVEDWRGRRAWKNYKHAWEARGERFDLASFVPPPVPNDQNFFETPLWDDMHFVQTDGVNVWERHELGGSRCLRHLRPQGNDAPSHRQLDEATARGPGRGGRRITAAAITCSRLKLGLEAYCRGKNNF